MNNETVAGTPADPTARYTTLKLGRQTFHLCFDFDAVAKAEQMTGMELLFGVDWSKISAPRMRAMLCACMLKAHPETKPEDLTQYIVHKNLFAIQEALVEAWVNSTPDAHEQESPQQPEPSPANA